MCQENKISSLIALLEGTLRSFLSIEYNHIAKQRGISLRDLEGVSKLFEARD
jgi:hypothetical protein